LGPSRDHEAPLRRDRQSLDDGQASNSLRHGLVFGVRVGKEENRARVSKEKNQARVSKEKNRARE